MRDEVKAYDKFSGSGSLTYAILARIVETVLAEDLVRGVFGHKRAEDIVEQSDALPDHAVPIAITDSLREAQPLRIHRNDRPRRHPDFEIPLDDFPQNTR